MYNLKLQTDMYQPKYIKQTGWKLKTNSLALLGVPNATKTLPIAFMMKKITLPTYGSAWHFFTDNQYD